MAPENNNNKAQRRRRGGPTRAEGQVAESDAVYNRPDCSSIHLILTRSRPLTTFLKQITKGLQFTVAPWLLWGVQHGFLLIVQSALRHFSM